ncbi:unnamed protein product [Echinostoma caproni]|uniref:Protocadherin-1 n=1 Tax=Echinostoma caproni TaxID=27848 RepID=A0A183A8I1_9TREM|nr:unnamed protein product [Echinostoma caproni]
MCELSPLCVKLCLLALLFVNRNPSAYEIRLKDNTAKGTQLAPNVLPELRGENRIYSLLQTRGSQYFALNNRTGQLTSARHIDRDMLCVESGLCCPIGLTTATALDSIGRTHTHSSSIQLAQACVGQQRYEPSVLAQACVFNLSVSVVTATGQQPDIHQITVTICEENDHAPQFKIPDAENVPGSSSVARSNKDLFLSETVQYTINVSEAVPVDHYIPLPLAEDIDAPPFNVQRYELERLEPAILNTQPNSYAHSRTSQTPFSLKLTWDNGGARLGLNGDTHPFAADEPRSNIIRLGLVLVEPLDRESVSRYQYRVLAIDGGSAPHTGTLLLEIRVVDTNDHAPQFTKAVYETTVDEGMTGNEIIQLMAVDADEGPNAVIRYDWPENFNAVARTRSNRTHFPSMKEPASRDELMAAPPSYWFHLNEDTGKISIRRPLDYEIKSQYRFHVLAHNPISVKNGDLGDRRGPLHRIMSATASVIVNVRNIDDEPPQIKIDYASGSNQKYKEITENSASSFFVAFVTVSDPDVDSELAKMSIHRGSSELNAFADPANYGSHTVRVLDENDCTPELKVFSPITAHSARQDPLDPWSFTKLGQWIEKQRDTSVPVHPSLLNAYLAQVPVFTVHVAENQPSGTVFARIRAQDLDAGENGRVTFDLPRQPPLINGSHSSAALFPDQAAHSYEKIELPSSPEASKLFTIDPTRGDVSTRKVIDREEGDAILEQSFLVVRATDHGSPARTALLLLHILVDDENDNPPMFFESKMHFNIRENLPAPTIVGEIRIIDPDLRPVGAFEPDQATYGLQGPTYPERLDYAILYPRGQLHRKTPLHVRIDPSHNRRDLPFVLYPTADGRFFLNTTRPLDRESEEAFQFILIAVDGGDVLQTTTDRLEMTGPRKPKQHTATASVLITVLDENDNHPEIIFPNPSASNSTIHRVSFREHAGYEIVNINANDRDAGETNGKFYFELIPGSRSEDLFTIDRVSGLLRTRRRLTKEDLGEYTLHVVVRDQGDPPLETQLTLHLIVDQSEPHWPYTSRTNLNYYSSRSATSHSGPVPNEADGYLAKGTGSAGGDGLYSADGEPISPGEIKRPIHADIMLFVIVALILGLVIIMFGLCLYLRHKKNLFLFLPDLCGGCSPCMDGTESGSRTMGAKANYTKTYMDLEHRGTHSTVAAASAAAAPSSPSLFTNLLSGESAGGKKSHLFNSASPLQSPIPSNRGHPVRSSTTGITTTSGPFGQPHSRSSFNVNSPYGNYNTSRDPVGPNCPMIDGMPIRQGMQLSPTIIGSEGLFCPSSSAYRPGTTMAVNIPDVANQAEYMRKQYTGYCRTTHPGVAYGPPVDHVVDSGEFADSVNGPTNTYHVGHYVGHRIGQTYAPPDETGTMFAPPVSFEQFPRFGFQPIEEDLHPYQRIAPTDQHYVGNHTLAPLSNPKASKHSQGRHGRHKTGRIPNTSSNILDARDQDPNTGALNDGHLGGSSTWKANQLTQWRSDPSLNHFEVNPIGPYALRSGHRSTYEFNNTIHARHATPRKQLKRSNSNKHGTGRGINGYYSTLHESAKQPSSPKLMLVDFAGSKLVPDDESTRPSGNYAVSFPKIQASFV